MRIKLRSSLSITPPKFSTSFPPTRLILMFLQRLPGWFQFSSPVLTSPSSFDSLCCGHLISELLLSALFHTASTALPLSFELVLISLSPYLEKLNLTFLSIDVLFRKTFSFPLFSSFFVFSINSGGPSPAVLELSALFPVFGP